MPTGCSCTAPPSIPLPPRTLQQINAMLEATRKVAEDKKRHKQAAKQQPQPQPPKPKPAKPARNAQPAADGPDDDQAAQNRRTWAGAGHRVEMRLNPGGARKEAAPGAAAAGAEAAAPKRFIPGYFEEAAQPAAGRKAAAAAAAAARAAERDAGGEGAKAAAGAKEQRQQAAAAAPRCVWVASFPLGIREAKHGIFWLITMMMVGVAGCFAGSEGDLPCRGCI